jgi:hypothetical protein
MPIADNFVAAAVLQGKSKLYIDLGGGSGEWDGAAGARLLLDASGAPLDSQNPNALHLGYTQEGLEWLVRPEFLGFTPDEELDPIIFRPQSEEKVISGGMWQAADLDLAEALVPTSTRSDIFASKGLTFGGKQTITYTSVAAIAPLALDPTRFAVFHLYKAFNDQGLAAQLGKTKVSNSPFAFRGLAISTRAEGDRAGRYFVTNAGAPS